MCPMAHVLCVAAVCLFCSHCTTWLVTHTHTQVTPVEARLRDVSTQLEEEKRALSALSGAAHTLVARCAAQAHGWQDTAKALHTLALFEGVSLAHAHIHTHTHLAHTRAPALSLSLSLSLARARALMDLPSYLAEDRYVCVCVCLAYRRTATRRVRVNRVVRRARVVRAKWVCCAVIIWVRWQTHCRKRGRRCHSHRCVRTHTRADADTHTHTHIHAHTHVYRHTRARGVLGYTPASSRPAETHTHTRARARRHASTHA